MLSLGLMTVFETIRPLSDEGIFFKLLIAMRTMMPPTTIEIIITTIITNVNESVFNAFQRLLVLLCLKVLLFLLTMI